MSQRIWGSGAAPALESVVPMFVFRLGGELVEWNWADGSPPWRELESVREPKARALSRHIPSSPFCWTTQSRLAVESGLEHDLLRELDRDPEVTWLVAQPCRLLLADGAHVPDIVEVRGDQVKVWDVRPRRRQDLSFLQLAARTQAACSSVGLSYGVFDDAKEVRRQNLRWLGAYRCPEELWPLDVVISMIEAGRATTVGEVLDQFDGQPVATAALWHLVWSGEVVVDLDAVLCDDSGVRLR